MIDLDTLIAQEPPFHNRFYDWLVEVRKTVSGDTAVSETNAVSAWRRGVAPGTYADDLLQRQGGK